jgi:hypothetical protein
MAPNHAPDDDLRAYVGLDADAAEQRARERGWSTVRRLSPDAVVTMEFRAGRLNFTVERGRVSRCWHG